MVSVICTQKSTIFSKGLIERAERCGYKALVLTVDACIVGNRECDVHNNLFIAEWYSDTKI